MELKRAADPGASVAGSLTIAAAGAAGGENLTGGGAGVTGGGKPSRRTQIAVNHNISERMEQRQMILSVFVSSYVQLKLGDLERQCKTQPKDAH